MATSKLFTGDDFEQAYAKVLGGTVNGGFNDKGNDVTVPGFGPVQVKASAAGAREFLMVSLKRKQFIPLCIGEPGAKNEMIASLNAYGAWVGNDIANRVQVLQGVATVRGMILAQAS